MASTNVNSGSERSQEAKEALPYEDLKRVSPNSKPIAAMRFKMEKSVLHPSSPSKIQIDAPDSSKRLSEPETGSESQCSHNKIPPVTIFDIIKKVWDLHKGTIYGTLRTFLALLIFLIIKRAIQRLLPIHWQLKIRKFLLWNPVQKINMIWLERS